MRIVHNSMCINLQGVSVFERELHRLNCSATDYFMLKVEQVTGAKYLTRDPTQLDKNDKRHVSQ